MNPKIQVKGVSKIYKTRQGTVEALASVDLTVEEGEFVSLIGPSECGKSILLRILANLYEATSGEVIIRASTLNHRPVNSVVFQEYAVFPWRTTVENVAFGLEMRGVSKKERQEIARTYGEANGGSEETN